MDSPKVLAARYRAAAKKVRKRASACGRSNASKGFLGVAESYDTLAKVTEGMNKGPVEPTDRQA